MMRQTATNPPPLRTTVLCRDGGNIFFAARMFSGWVTIPRERAIPAPAEYILLEVPLGGLIEAVGQLEMKL